MQGNFCPQNRDTLDTFKLGIRSELVTCRLPRIKFCTKRRKGKRVFYQNIPDRECTYIPGTLLDIDHTKRKSIRTITNGIVALTNLAMPVVTKIYDIAPGGVSFVYFDEIDVTEGSLEMDILIFNIRTEFEYLLDQVMGRVRSKKFLADPKSRKPTWRYGVEFVDLDREKQQRLKILCNPIASASKQEFL